MCGTGIGNQRKRFGAIIRGSRCLAGAIVLDPLKSAALWRLGRRRHYHVTKMAVTPLNPQWPKPPVIRKLHGSVFYSLRPKLFLIKVFFHCVNREFRLVIAKNGRKCYFSFVPPNWLTWYRNTFSGPLSTVLAWMILWEPINAESLNPAGTDLWMNLDHEQKKLAYIAVLQDNRHSHWLFVY